MNIAIYIALLAAGPAAAQAPVALEMKCHEMMGGRPSRTATVYRLDGTKLYRDTVLISDTKPLEIGTTTDDKGPEASIAEHAIAGMKVTRRVFWQRPGQARKLAFVEVYDFKTRTVRDSTGADSCNASAFAKRR